jgi:CTP:molybdopterin cytidylyltransferase MocA
VIVVVREATALALRALAATTSAELCISREDDELGPAGSIARALSVLDDLDDDTAVVITPVDCPPADEHLVRALLARFGAEDRPLAVRPRHGDRRGHPVVVRARLLRSAYRGSAPPPLREMLRANLDRVVDLRVDDANILVDFDVPEDLVRYRSTVAEPRE